MKRIGMILDAQFPPDYRVEKEALTLIEAGFEVYLFCVSYDDAPAGEDYRGIRIRRYRSNRLEYKLSALAYTVPFYRLAMARKIADFVRKNNIEILHVHDMVIAEAALSVARQHGCRMVLDLHENRPEIMREYRHVNRFPGTLLINLETWRRKQNQLATQADKVVVVTDLARQDLIVATSRDAADIAVVPNTPSMDFMNKRLNDEIIEKMADSFNLLYVGDTSERRGTPSMLKVVKLLENDIPNIALWIVGRSSFDHELKQLADSLSIASRVSFEGWQPETLFPSYIVGSHVCLSPLNRNIHHDTTYANKIFQYMAMGRACVVSDCTAQAQLINGEECGLVYQAGSVEDFADAVRELYHNPARRKQMGENGRLAVLERWNWKTTSTSLITLYRSLK